MTVAPMNPKSNVTVNEYARRLAEQSKTPDEFLVEPKIYFHHHNFARFHVDLGDSRVKTIAFANHRYITDDKREQDQIDMVADVPGTFIYTLPDNEAKHAIEEELQRELTKSVMQTAEARTLTNKQVFDPNVPVVPVQVQQVHPTPMQVMPANTGMQNTMNSGMNTTTMRPTLPEDQVIPPVSQQPAAAPVTSADKAALELQDLTERASAAAKKNTPGIP